MNFNLIMPAKNGNGDDITVECQSNVVIIGANGSGKSRLGAWIESRNNIGNVHRVAAQRSLAIPDYVTLKSYEQAYDELFYGSATDKNKGNRWGYDNRQTTTLLNDYNSVLSTLFAKQAKSNNDFVRIYKANTLVNSPQPTAPKTEIDIIHEIWQDIFPHRQILLDDAKITAQSSNSSSYHGKEMSDGERVAIYLIGQCLSAKDGQIIIIDEPELHLHKSLMVRLWNKIEEYCPNKLLIYITHDLDFAASRKGAYKVWIKSFEGGVSWTWDTIPEIEELPENLIIEIIGNRKNIIFTEGDKSSYDTILYQYAFPEFHIVPRGGCAKVIESAKATRATPALHTFAAFGIIDSDFRTAEEIAALQQSGIYTIGVAEVENLFCIEPLIRIVASHLNLNQDSVVAQVTNLIVDSLGNELEAQIVKHAEREIQFRLNAFNKAGNTEQGLTDGLNRLLGTFDVHSIYSNSKLIFQSALQERNLEKVLKIYNRKSLAGRVSSIFGLKDGEYPNIVIRMLKSEKREQMVNSLRSYMPLLA